MREPFHRYHARRQLERDTAMPVLDAPTMTIRLRRRHRSLRASAPALTLGISAILAMLIERLSA